MLEKYQLKRVVQCAIVFVGSLTLAFAIGCVDETVEEEIAQPEMVSRGMITASFNRYIDSRTEEPYETFGLTGAFARFDSEASQTVDLLFDTVPADMDLPIDTCTIPSPILDESRFQTGHNDTAIELLDVGDLSVTFDKQKTPIPTRTFPDLLKLMVGVTYAADDTQGVVYQPGQTYDVRAAGTDNVADFRTVLDAPQDLGIVRVEGISPDERNPVVSREKGVEITWDGDGYGDEVIVNLNWTSMGSPWGITCRIRDDGLFVIPRSITAGLPDPITSTDEEISIQRVRQVAFRSPNLSSGSFKFVVSTNFSVRF